MKIATTDTQLHALEGAANKKHRKNATTVDVPIDALRAILADHFTMIAACKRSIEPGQDQRSLA